MAAPSRAALFNFPAASCKNLSQSLMCSKIPHLKWHASSSRGSEAASGRPLYDALLVDVGGTLLETSRPVPEVYAAIGAKYGLKVSPDDIKQGFKKAFAKPWPERLRYEGDGRPFWRFAVATATGCADANYFEDLYQHFASGDAWSVSEGAKEALTLLRDAGVKLAVVSNFDTRLRPVLRDLEVDTLFDAVIVSSEIGYEKPSPHIFQAALVELGIQASAAVHVGDDLVADKQGANAVGMDAWLWKKEVRTFEEIANRILKPVKAELT